MGFTKEAGLPTLRKGKYGTYLEIILSPITDRVSSDTKERILYHAYCSETFFWFLVLAVFPLIIFAFLPFEEAQWRCLYVVLVVVFGWVFNYTDVAIIAFVPITFAPLLNLQTVGEQATAYFGTTIILYVSAAIVGGGFQSVGLDKRFALFMMTGSSLQAFDIIWRFLLISGIVSMWISNTASATLTIPILRQLLIMIESYFIRLEATGVRDPRVFKAPKTRLNFDQFKAAAFIAMSYGANFGGMFTKVGTTTNLAFATVFEGIYGQNTPFTFANFSVFSVPLGILTLLFCYITMLFAWEGIGNSFRTFGYIFKSLWYAIIRHDPNRGIAGAAEYREAEKAAMEDLGPWSYAEKVMGTMSLITILLLFFRDPGLGFPGWSYIITFLPGGTDDAGNTVGFTHDSTSTLIMAVLIFLIPKYSTAEIKKATEANPEKQREIFVQMTRARLLDWRQCEEYVDWGVMWMLGCGAGLASLMNSSGLSATIGAWMTSVFLGLSEPVIVLIVVVISNLFTELASNTVITQIFAPILIAVSIDELCWNPLYLGFVSLMAVTYALVLPVASPSNILVFKAADIKTVDFFRSGWLMKLLGIPLTMFATFTYGYNVFDFGHFPSWAVGVDHPNANTTCVATDIPAPT